MYAQEIGRIAEEPYGAAETAPRPSVICDFPVWMSISGCFGRNGARCFFLKTFQFFVIFLKKQKIDYPFLKKKNQNSFERQN